MIAELFLCAALSPRLAFIGSAKPAAFHESYVLYMILPEPNKPALEILPFNSAKVFHIIGEIHGYAMFLELQPHYLPFTKETFSVLINSERENPYADGLRRELGIKMSWRIAMAIEWFSVLEPSGWLITNAEDYFEVALKTAGFVPISIRVDGKKVFVKKRLESSA